VWVGALVALGLGGGGLLVGCAVNVGVGEGADSTAAGPVSRLASLVLEETHPAARIGHRKTASTERKVRMPIQTDCSPRNNGVLERPL
jgi:hypothetical protein